MALCTHTLTHILIRPEHVPNILTHCLFVIHSDCEKPYLIHTNPHPLTVRFAKVATTVCPSKHMWDVLCLCGEAAATAIPVVRDRKMPICFACVCLSSSLRHTPLEVQLQRRRLRCQYGQEHPSIYQYKSNGTNPTRTVCVIYLYILLIRTEISYRFNLRWFAIASPRNISRKIWGVSECVSCRSETTASPCVVSMLLSFFVVVLVYSNQSKMMAIPHVHTCVVSNFDRGGLGFC